MGSVRVGVGSAGEMGQHRERAGESQQAVRARTARKRPVGEFVNEAGNMGEFFRERTRVGEALETIAAASGCRGEWNGEHGMKQPRDRHQWRSSKW